MKNILVIGLGLIGGSIAKSLNKTEFNVFGMDTNSQTIEKAINDKAIVQKFNNIEEFHQYIPTLASKKTLMLSDGKHETTDIIEDTMNDDQESLMSNISIGSQGEIKSKKTLLSPKSVKSVDKQEEDDKTEILSLIKSKSSQDDKVDISEKESEESEESTEEESTEEQSEDSGDSESSEGDSGSESSEEQEEQAPAEESGSDEQTADEFVDKIIVPKCPPMIATIPTTITLQLLSYHIAVLRGCDVDQPRNLAKSVTVE